MRILILFFVLGSVCHAELRTWTAVNGNKVEANYISSSKGIVKLRLKSGKLFEVPKNKLSKEDNEFINSLFKKEVAVGSGVRKNLSRAVNGDKVEKPVAETKSVEEIPLNPNLKYEIKDGTVTITGCDKKASGALTIPATIEGKPVTSIGKLAFILCTSLTSITIPDSVTSIGHQAFNSCTHLTAVTFLGDAPKTRRQVFEDSVPTIYRKPEAKGWGDTFAGRPVKLSKEDNEFLSSLAKLDGVNGEGLEERIGIFYLKDSDTPYTGKMFRLYKNGQKQSEGNFKNGKPDGLIRGWHENGQKSGEGNHKDGKLHGLSVMWYEDGQKMVEANYKDGKEDGVMMMWHENGQKRGEGNYKDGKFEGPSVEWHPNGQKKSELNYKDGELDGQWTRWNESGQKIREENYKDGKGDGLQRRWHEKGQKKVEANFKDGKQNGLQVEWYKNGQTAMEANWKDGKKHGLVVGWDKNGQKRREENYKDGKLISRKYWNSKGEPVDSEKEAEAE